MPVHETGKTAVCASVLCVSGTRGTLIFHVTENYKGLFITIHLCNAMRYSKMLHAWREVCAVNDTLWKCYFRCVEGVQNEDLMSEKKQVSVHVHNDGTQTGVMITCDWEGDGICGHCLFR